MSLDVAQQSTVLRYCIANTDREKVVIRHCDDGFAAAEKRDLFPEPPPSSQFCLMSDQSTPPRPKPGSLRDRIAAFEKPAGGAPTPSAPAPRPKPGGGISWKPKAPSPPSSPSSSDVSGSGLAEKKSGMSAMDAKESIKTGGSLKERMAALQNRGGFGAPAPPVAPKPAIEKPKWKPPPVVAPVEREDDDAHAREDEISRPPGPPIRKSSSGDRPPEEKGEGEAEAAGEARSEAEAELDPEEEERQRRANIAARMARLGGARVGMAPMFGRPPSTKKSEPEPEPVKEAPATDHAGESQPQKETSPPSDEPTAVPAPDLVEKLTVTSDIELPSAPEPVQASAEPLSLQSEASTTVSASQSMPVPTAPRRAAPPRRKTPKAPEVPAPEPAVIMEHIVSSPEPDNAAAAASNLDAIAAEEDKPTEPVAIDHEVPPVIVRDFAKEPVSETSLGADDTKEQEDSGSPVPVEESGTGVPVGDEEVFETADEEQEHAVKATPAQVQPEPSVQESAPGEEEERIEEQSQHVQAEEHVEESLQETEEEAAAVQSPPADELDEEDEEAARRQRIAEKLAKMGGVNPFALPPQRKASGSSEDVHTSLPSLSKRASVSSPPLPPLPTRRQSTRDSIMESSHDVEPVGLQSPSPPTKDTATGSTNEPEDDGQEVDQDARTAATVRHAVDDDHDTETTAPRETSKIHHEPTAVPEAEEESTYESDEEMRDAESEAPPPPPPSVPHPSTRPVNIPPPPVPSASVEPVADVQESTRLAAAPFRRSLPPPPRLVPETPEPEEDRTETELAYASSPLAPSSPLDQSYQPSEEDDEEPPRPLLPRRSNLVQSEEPVDDEPPPLPVPNRRSMQSDDFIPPSGKRLSAQHPTRPVPLPPPGSEPVLDVDESDFDEVLPTPPRHRPVTPGTPPVQSATNEIPLIVPPPGPAGDAARRADPSPLRQSSYPQEAVERSSVSVASDESSSPALLSPPVSSPPLPEPEPTREVLDEDEGDPIDPSFHSPSRRASVVTIPTTKPPPPQDPVVPEEDEQTARRRTIAERMAKLGGIKFGAAPPLPHAMRPPPPAPRAPREEEEEAAPATEHPDEQQPAEGAELTEEEEERARKERIAAKLAMMGGMRIGMMPLGVGAGRPPPSQGSHVSREERPPPPPSRAPPSRPPPPPQAHDSEYDSGLSASQYSNATATSDEGVKVEAEDSEIEEVSYADADAEDLEEEPEEVRPPVPARGPRRREAGESETEHALASTPPRPPVPTVLPTRTASIQSTASARKSSVDSSQGVPRSAYKTQSEYVMVGEASDSVPEEDVPPPPPARPSHRPPPPRAAPPPPPPSSMPISDSISSQWEMPSIPSSSIEFTTPADISLTWPEDSASASSSSRSPPPPPAPQPPAAPVDVVLSSDELMTLWGRVGVQVCEAATSLHEKSKKALIGDGTYDGFVHAVLSEVPNAAMPVSETSYGYLVYAQTGNTVQKRASEILPGDIMVLQEAKLKGHKGLQSYQQIVGIGQQLVGVVSEFEPKKSKVRLFQANQHVGQQTVEAVSYRLEDLKSGTVKVIGSVNPVPLTHTRIQVFRVLES
ncbi:hypothetical protein H0H92_014743 [Tricholoma furcatifolium]|nr:hypothetical protein H0H92_014743 [Tricholoma furcatifolium]